MNVFDEQAFGALVERAVEKAVRKVLRTEPAIAEGDASWVPTAQLAKAYTIGQGTIRRWIREGKIDAMQVGRSLRVNRASFERVLAMPRPAVEKTPSPEELADRDQIRERRSKKP